MRYVQFALLAVVAVLTLILWSGGGGEQSARAYPGLTAGIDLNPNNSDPDLDGVYDPVDVATFDSCLAISGPGVQFDVDVFVLDVVDLMAFSADVEYDSAVVEVMGVNTNLLLGSPPGSSVVDGSFPGPPGKYEAAAFDQNQMGADGSGVLARLTLQGVANGQSPFDLDLDPVMYRGVTLKDVNNVSLGDTSVPPDSLFDGPFINEVTTISVGGAGDTDGDGVPEGCDNCPGLWNDQTDTDGDGMGDQCDPDDDNDGIPDFIPPGPDNCRLVPNPFDADGDGQDGEDPINGLDDDGDTLVDEDHELGQEDWNDGGGGDVCQDTDSDTVMDYPDNCRSDPNTNQADMDGDGVGDVCDPDKDGDAVLQDGDGSGTEGDNPCTGGATTNCDDNCPDSSNPDQADADGNGVGNVCQDSDLDGVYDPVDNCPATPNSNQYDADFDNVGDVCDNCQNDYNPGQENTDGDALGDVCDSDDDNDQVADTSDNCQFIPNGPQQFAIECVGNQTDTNVNGSGDPCDPNADSDLYPKVFEEGYGSKDCDALSTPEVCDGADNDGDTLADEGQEDPPIPFSDIDADNIPDCVDNDVNTDGQGPFNCLETGDADGDGVADCLDLDADSDEDTIPDPQDPDAGDPDDDGDGTDDVDENIIVTNSLLGCEDDIGYPDWPPDFDYNHTINILDVGEVLPPTFGSTMGNPDYDIRQDLVPNGVINILDVGKVYPPTFGSTCTP